MNSLAFSVLELKFIISSSFFSTIIVRLSTSATNVLINSRSSSYLVVSKPFIWPLNAFNS